MPRRRTGPAKSTQDRSLPKYSIAVAADLSGVPQQQLRRMEESGLLTPNRTEGNTRRYSDDNLTQIAEVADLAEAGINAAGIRHILALHTELAALRAENDELRSLLARNTGGKPAST
ncbi:MAG: MerR family transcriptional regulator [Ktedonobacterales bacterium]